MLSLKSSSLTLRVTIGRRRGLTSSNPVPGLRDIQEERSSELSSSLSRLLESDLQSSNSRLTLGVADQVSADRAPIGCRQHVDAIEPRGGSGECMTRSYLASIMNASNFTTWIVSKAKKEPDLDFHQYFHPISADHLLTLTPLQSCTGLDNDHNLSRARFPANAH